MNHKGSFVLNLKLLSRHLILLIGTAIAGVLSGFFYLRTMGVRGALLGMSLGFGVILINSIEQNRLSLTRPPRTIIVLFVVIIAGLIGGTLVNLYGMGLGYGYLDFPPSPTADGFPTIMVSICYSVLILFAYAQRWKFEGNIKKIVMCFLFLAIAGILGTGSKLFFEPAGTISIRNIFEMFIFALFSGVAFSFLWGIAVIPLDPAWSLERWQATAKKD